MSDFTFTEDSNDLFFNPVNGVVEAVGPTGDYVRVDLPKHEAINLASKLLQWGTSS